MNLLIGLTLTLLLSAAAPAQDVAVDLDPPITVDVVEADAATTFAQLEKVLGIPVEVAPEIVGKLSIRVERVKRRTFLDAACESLGCAWTVSDGTLRIWQTAPASSPLRADLESPLTMSLRCADVGQVLETFKTLTGVDIEVDPRLAGRCVTIELESVPTALALTEVCRQTQAKWRWADGEPARIVVEADPK